MSILTHKTCRIMRKTWHPSLSILAVSARVLLAFILLSSNHAWAQTSIKDMRELNVKNVFCRGKTVETWSPRRGGNDDVTTEQFSDGGFLTYYSTPNGGLYIDVMVPGASTAALSNAMRLRTTDESIRGELSEEDGTGKYIYRFKMNRTTGEFETYLSSSNAFGIKKEVSNGVCDEVKGAPPPKRF